MATTETPRLSLVLGARASEWVAALRGARWRWMGVVCGRLRWTAQCRLPAGAPNYDVALEGPVSPAVSLWVYEAQRTWTWDALLELVPLTEITLCLGDSRTIDGQWEGTLVALLGLADAEQAAPSVWVTCVPAQFSWAADDSPQLTIECPGCGARLPLRYEGQPPTRMRATCDRCRLTVTYRLAYEARTPEVAWIT
jgi:hypothetical protein